HGFRCRRPDVVDQVVIAGFLGQRSRDGVLSEVCSYHRLVDVSPTGTSIASLTTRSSIVSHAPFATPDVCLVKNCMRRGKWRGECGGSFVAAGSSTWVPDTGCWPRACSCL